MKVVIDHRFEVHHQRTRSLLEQFQPDLFATVDDERPPLVVLRNIIESFSAMLLA